VSLTLPPFSSPRTGTLTIYLFHSFRAVEADLIRRDAHSHAILLVQSDGQEGDIVKAEMVDEPEFGQCGEARTGDAGEGMEIELVDDVMDEEEEDE